MAYNTQNAEYGFNFTETDFLGGPYCGALSPVSISGGGKKRKQMRTKKKRGSSKRKNRRVSTLRKKRGSSKRKNRGSFKRRKHSKRDVVKSIMKGLGEKRKSRKKSMKGGIGEGWLKKREQNDPVKKKKEREKEKIKNNPFRVEQYKRSPSEVKSDDNSDTFEDFPHSSNVNQPSKSDSGYVSISAGIGH